MEHPGLHLIRVESLGDPRVADYANLRDKQLREEADPSACGGMFIAEGELVVRRLAASRFAVKSVLLTPTRLNTVADALGTLPPGTPVYVASQEVMNGVVGFNIHRGILACGLRAGERTLAEVVRDCRTLVVLEDLANHDNVGGIFRCVAALGGQGAGIVLSPGCCDPLYRKSLRVSMGHVLGVPYARAGDWPGAIGRMREAGFRTLALTPRGSVDIAETGVGRADRVALLLGCEGPGLSAAAMEVSEVRARIAMTTGVDSLNVVVAAGITLHGIARV